MTDMRSQSTVNELLQTLFNLSSYGGFFFETRNWIDFVLKGRVELGLFGQV